MSVRWTGPRAEPQQPAPLSQIFAALALAAVVAVGFALVLLAASVVGR